MQYKLDKSNQLIHCKIFSSGKILASKAIKTNKFSKKIPTFSEFLNPNMDSLIIYSTKILPTFSVGILIAEVICTTCLRD